MASLIQVKGINSGRTYTIPCLHPISGAHKVKFSRDLGEPLDWDNMTRDTWKSYTIDEANIPLTGVHGDGCSRTMPAKHR